MPANLTPEYKAAESAFRKARDSKQRLECLQEMLRTIPKHKGTDHLQADIKSRIKELKHEVAGPKKGGARRGPVTVIRPEGAAQIALIGSPSVGKSTLHARLTRSNAPSAAYHFTTLFPQPGMLPYQDIYFQVIDLPPLSADYPVAWFANALQPANAALWVVDISDPGCLDEAFAVQALLAEKHVTLVNERVDPPRKGNAAEQGESSSHPFALRLPTLMVFNKADLVGNLAAEIQVFKELIGVHYPELAVSSVTGQGLNQFGPWLFEQLGVVRVYTKAPGRTPDTERPFVVRRSQTVYDVAVLVHRDIAEALKYARLWRGEEFQGLQVGADHIVLDKDILELHT